VELFDLPYSQFTGGTPYVTKKASPVGLNIITFFSVEPPKCQIYFSLPFFCMGEKTLKPSIKALPTKTFPFSKTPTSGFNKKRKVSFGSSFSFYAKAKPAPLKSLKKKKSLSPRILKFLYVTGFFLFPFSLGTFLGIRKEPRPTQKLT